MARIKEQQTIWSYIATVWPLGYFPKAPGTAGSLAGLAMALPFHYGEAVALTWFLAGIVLMLFAYVAVKKTEQLWQEHDSKKIVIDEVVGQFIGLAPACLTLNDYILGFLAFRILDILKPGPIGWLDRELKGPWGTLLDDVVCGGIVAVGFLLSHKL